ncbi:MAG: cation transporter [Gammaproteobacteria bacterium]|nr:cation transporter [Gammaproteobacteria bacterium]MCB1902982.1 cation transporter [Gammaproteobacteria bacterium]
MPATIELEIQGMTCQHCVKRATKALESVPGVEGVEVTLEPGAASVSGSCGSSELIKAVESAGYKAALK